MGLVECHTRQLWPTTIRVSILVIVEMGLVAPGSHQFYIILECFNPCYSGNGFGSGAND